MKHTLALALMVTLTDSGCQTCTKCVGPTGPPVDFDAALPQVEAVFVGPFVGAIADQPGNEVDGIHFEPCAVAGQAFTVALEVGRPSCAETDGEGAPIDCGKARQAWFPFTGALTVASDAPRTITGGVDVRSSEGGSLTPFSVELGLVSPEFPRENLTGLLTPGSLADAVMSGFSWERRLSAENASTVTWEVCGMTVTP